MALAKKQLTPNQFGLNLTPVNASTLQTRVEAGLKAMNTQKKISTGVFTICMDILKESSKGRDSFKVDFARWLTDQEVGIIVSDFGEVSGALYMLKRSGTEYAKVKFPTLANEKLIDYILVDKSGIDHPYSAKAGKGGKPSITAITPILANVKGLKGKEKVAADVMLNIGIEEKTDRGTSTGTDLFKGPLLAAEMLGSDIPAYAELIKVLKNPKLKTGYKAGIPTVEHLDNAMENAGKYPFCADTFFVNFLKAAKSKGFEIKDDSAVIRAINLSPFNLPGGKPHRDKRWGLLHYPITANMINWLNKPENKAKDLLTKVASTLSVTQIYLDVYPTKKPNSCNYLIKEFGDSKFEFGSPSSTPNPVGNRIGLTVVKK